MSRCPKLRIKKGCTTCRNRRKKCDENRTPDCATCTRLGLSCEWPDLTTLQDRRERRADKSRWSRTHKSPELSPAAVLPAAPKSQRLHLLEGTPYSSPASVQFEIFYDGILSTAQIFLRSDREVTLMTSYCESFIPANILPTAHSKFSKMYVGDVQELRDSMLACSSVQLANKIGQPPVEALSYYTRAVTGLRKRLDTGGVTGLEDWLLAATCLLHCFETWRCDDNQSAPLAFQHLLGAIQLLKVRAVSLVKQGSDLQTLIAESVIFHVSTLLALDSSFATLDVDSELWEWIEIIFHSSDHSDALTPLNHPVLGTPRQLNRLLFEISKLSMRRLVSGKDTEERERLSTELKRWESQELSQNKVSQDDPYAEARKLYIICARILLLSIGVAVEIDEAAALQQHQLREYLEVGIGIIFKMKDTNEEAWNFLLRWPLRVLGTMVEKESDRQMICFALKRLWLNSSCGDVKRSLERL